MRAACVIGLSLAASAVPASAATWTTPQPVATLAAGFGAASNARGDAVVAWTQPERGGGVHTEVAVAAPHHRFGPSVALDPLGGSGGEKPPSVAIDRGGNAIVVWTGSPIAGGPSYGDYPLQRVYAAVKPAGGRWAVLRALSSETGRAVGARVAVDKSGAATCAWLEVEDDFVSARVMVAERRRGGAFGRPREVGTSSPSALPAVAAGGTSSLVAWAEIFDPNPGVFYALRTRNGFSADIAIPGTRGVNELAAAADDAGGGLLAWKSGEAIEMSRYTARGSMGEARSVGRVDAYDIGPELSAAGGAGGAAVAWSEPVGIRDVVKVASAAPGGAVGVATGPARRRPARYSPGSVSGVAAVRSPGGRVDAGWLLLGRQNKYPDPRAQRLELAAAPRLAKVVRRFGFQPLPRPADPSQSMVALVGTGANARALWQIDGLLSATMRP